VIEDFSSLTIPGYRDHARAEKDLFTIARWHAVLAKKTVLKAADNKREL
jgi:hypothetical protein